MTSSKPLGSGAPNVTEPSASVLSVPPSALAGATPTPVTAPLMAPLVLAATPPEPTAAPPASVGVVDAHDATSTVTIAAARATATPSQSPRSRSWLSIDRKPRRRRSRDIVISPFECRE